MKISNDIEAFSNANISIYQYIKRLKIEREFTGGFATKYNLTLILTALKGEDALDLKASFFDVMEIKIGNISDMHCSFLAIDDISSWQWEGVSYQITDSENDAFSFKCAKFEILF